jgi:TonB family protein
MRLARDPRRIAAVLSIAAVQGLSAGQLPAALRADEVSVPPTILTRVEPEYSGTIISGPLKRTIQLEVLIDTEGRVQAASVLGPQTQLKDFENGAVAAARRWTFQPARHGDAVVPVRLPMTVELTSTKERIGQRDRDVVTAHIKATSARDSFGEGAIRDEPPGFESPRLTRRVDPRYTPSAMQAKVQGVVMYDAVIGIDGRISATRLVKSLGQGLDEQALGALRQWQFEPARLNGKPVAATALMVVGFRLY